jgi:hypothetical protein
MTPFELALQNDLDVEALRFINKWLFIWYNYNIQGRVVPVSNASMGTWIEDAARAVGK